MELEILQRIVSEVMMVDPKEVTGETTFVDDLGADSLDLCRVIMGIEERFSIKLPNDSIYSISTIEDAVKLIRKIKKN